MTTEHGRGCGCGTDVSGIDRLLTSEDLAEHLDVPRSTLRVYATRARAGTSPAAPTWFRPASMRLGNTDVWTWQEAEAMRINRGQKH